MQLVMKTLHMHNYRDFARSIPRPFCLGYDAHTDSVEVIDDKPSIQREVQLLKARLDLIGDAVNKL